MLMFYLLAIVVGIIGALQAGINSELARTIGDNLWAAIISCAGGILVLLFCALLTQQPLSLKKFLATPPYLLIGGALGAMIVLSIIFLFPRVGATNVFIFIVTGQMIFSLVVDHYGWFGAAISLINWQKLAALLLMLVAVFWFQKSRI